MFGLDSFWELNRDAFWVNIAVGLIFFLLSVATSVWLVPAFTIRLIRKRNRKFYKQKVSFTIQELCDFFNRMPSSFRPAQRRVTIISATDDKYPDVKQFVAHLEPDLLRPVALEELIVNLLTTIRNADSGERYDLLRSEVIRIESLRESLENVVGIHSGAMEDDIINEVSRLCLDIRMVIREHRHDQAIGEVLNRKDGVFALQHLRVVYENALGLLKRLVVQPDFSFEARK